MAEGEEELWMSAKDRDRLKVLHEVRRQHITQLQAARELGISSRWVRALLKRMKQEGDCAVVHCLRGQPSNRKLPTPLPPIARAEYGSPSLHWLLRNYHPPTGLALNQSHRYTLPYHLFEELLEQLRLLKPPVPVLGERGMVRNLLIEAETGEPSPRQMHT